MGCGCGGSYHPAQPCDIYHRPAAMDIDYGTPVDALCKETSAGVFRREWSKATVEVDCNRFSSEIRMKSDDGALRSSAAPPAASASCSSEHGGSCGPTRIEMPCQSDADCDQWY